jgi:hypothetical protein
MKTKNLTRKEAVLACLDGHNVGHERYNNGFVTFQRSKGFKYYNTGKKYAIDSEFSYDDGYYIIQDKLTFEKIRKECVPMKRLLVDEEGEEWLYLGFSRKGKLVTDSYGAYGTAIWLENEIGNWKIKPIEGE